MPSFLQVDWFDFSPLNLLLCGLILLVSLVVAGFSRRYLDGDRRYQAYFQTLLAITGAVLLMVMANTIWLFWAAWTLSNCLLVRLIMHKSAWLAARNAGLLAATYLLSGSAVLLLGLSLLSVQMQSSSLAEMQHIWTMNPELANPIAGSLILLAALIQSAIWPFHRWLISSMNAPTPVSALMHAGLVNGGGILVVKFYPLFLHSPALLTVLFLVGALTALIGTLWKLIQHDMKRMLACSTMAQMGFMMMQCGLGLFAAAIAHLCWHGLFKANLFLNSGSALEQPTNGATRVNPGLLVLLSAMTGAILGLYCFALVTEKPLFSLTANSFVLLFAWIAGTQILLSLLAQSFNLPRLLLGLGLVSLAGGLYGLNISLIERLLPDLAALSSQPLPWFAAAVLAVFWLGWLTINLGLMSKLADQKIGLWLYMRLLNASQPAAQTITAIRSNYQA